MAPEYFKERLTYSEADDYLGGLHRRYRAGWEQARMTSDVTAMCAGNKEGTKVRFSWEKDRPAPQNAAPTEDEVLAIEAEAEKLQRKLNGQE